MIQLVNSIIFLIGAVWVIIDRFKFKKSKEDGDKMYIALYREHNTLLIVMFFALCIYSFCNYIGI